jgi:hypothetical protein
MNNPLLQSVQLALHNGAQAEAIELIDKVVDFCIKHENGKVLDGWPRDLIQLLVAYHMAKDTILIDLEQDEEIKGVYMWYNCNEEDDWSFVQSWLPDQEDGGAIFMAFLYASNNEAFKRIAANFILKCPEVTTKKLIGIRHRQGAPTRITYTPKLFNKILGNIILWAEEKDHHQHHHQLTQASPWGNTCLAEGLRSYQGITDPRLQDRLIGRRSYVSTTIHSIRAC